MRFFKKNPKIEGDICVCGKPFSDDTVVFGEEFAPFADPKTFPGMEPRLVECQMNEIQGEKLDNLKAFETSRVPEPPRHSGGTTTANFHMEGEGAKIDILAPIRTAVAPTPKPVEDTPKVEEILKRSVVDEEKIPKVKLISELYSPSSMASECPGVNESSASKIIAKFKTLEDLASASNVDLRTAGIRSNYFNKVRAWAKDR